MCRRFAADRRLTPSYHAHDIRKYISTSLQELLSEFSDVIDEEEDGRQEDAEEAAGAAAPNNSTNGFGSAFKLTPSLQPSGGFGTASSGGGPAFGAAASQPAGSSEPAASQSQHQQSSSVADFLKGIPTPASQALTGFGSGKLPPIPAFNFSNAGKSTTAAGSGALDGDPGNGGAPASLGSKPPLFNFSTAFGGSSSTLPVTGPGGTGSPPAASPLASKPFGFGGAQPNTNHGGFGTAASSGSASSSVFGSKAPPFGSGGFAFGGPASAAPSAAASSSAAAPSLLPATSNGAASSAAPAASGGLFSLPQTQPLPSLFSFPGGKAGANARCQSVAQMLLESGMTDTPLKPLNSSSNQTFQHFIHDILTCCASSFTPFA
jgi:hypothetical protein